MARGLGVSEGTVRRRLAKLLDDRVIRVIAIAEPEQLGYHTSAFIGLQIDPSRVESVAETLAPLLADDGATLAWLRAATAPV